MLGIHRVFAFVTTLSQSRASLDPAVGSADHLPSMLHDDLQLRIPRVSLDIRVPSTERFHFAAAALASAAASRSRTKITSGTLIAVSGGGCERGVECEL